MKHSVVHQRAEAIHDAEQVIDYYLTEASVEVAMRWIAALERAFDQIAVHPGSGSPKYGHEVRIAGLRSWPLNGFPYLVLYLEGDELIEVVRILHSSRDIPAALQLEEQDS